MSGYGAGDEVLALAHRGGAALAAENTVVAFQRAIDLGYSYLETDVRVTKDGVCVALHDRRLRRVTGARGNVDDLTWSQLQSLRVFGREPVPRLAELLDRWPSVQWMIDVKQPASLASLTAVVHEAGAAHRVCLGGTWDGWLTAARAQLGPTVSTGLGWRSVADLLTGRRVDACGAAFAHVPLRFWGRWVPTRALVQRARAYGLRTVVWGVESSLEMHRLLDDGVHGIITDHPDVLREVLIARDAWTAPAAADTDGARPGHPRPLAVGRASCPSGDLGVRAGPGARGR